MGQGKRDVGTPLRGRAVNLERGLTARCVHAGLRVSLAHEAHIVDAPPRGRRKRVRTPFVATSGTVANPGETLRRGLTEMSQAGTEGSSVAASGTWVVCHTRSNSERSIGRATLAGGRNPVSHASASPVRMAATWLILPVVICLSQRLSHACLSINYFVL